MPFMNFCGSQSPENGSQHCKLSTNTFAPSTIQSLRRNPLKTGLSTARGRVPERICAGGLGRNPLKTGLSTASRKTSGDWKHVARIARRNPLKTGLSTARWKKQKRSPPVFQQSRNPLKTGLSTARPRGTHRRTQNPIRRRNPLKTGLSTASRTSRIDFPQALS